MFGQIQIVEKIADNQLKLIPDVYVSGGSAGAQGEQGGLMSLALLQSLTGKNLLQASASVARQADPV